MSTGAFLSPFDFLLLCVLDRPSVVTNLTHQARPVSEAGLARVEWLIPLAVVSALTFLCLVILLAVLAYWRLVKRLIVAYVLSLTC